MEAIVLWILAGGVLGIFTGLMPGIHVNTVSLIAVSIAGREQIGITLMIVTMSVVHSFLDFIPSILLAVPDNENFSSLLPGHRMFTKGKALLAIKLTAVGGLTAGIGSLLIAPLFFLFFKKTSAVLTGIIPMALILVMALMLLSEKNRLWGAIVMLLSAVLGIVVLDGRIEIREPLFPLVTGFFGTSSLIQSSVSRYKAVAQEKKRCSFPLQKVFFGSAMGMVSGMIVAVMPSIGSGQAAFIVKSLVGKIRTTTYLIIIGGINTANTIFAFFGLFAFGKARSGTAVAVKQLIELDAQSLFLIMIAITIGIGFGTIATIIISEIAVERMEKFDYKKINHAVIAFLVFLTIIISGIGGTIALFAATAIGLIAIFAGVKRTNCMAFLIIPTLIFYLTHSNML